MSGYKLSRKAQRDLETIFKYTYKEFGIEQARTYLLGLEECFDTLASQPQLAHRVDDIRTDYLRFLHSKHSIYFKVRNSGILVVRVLHQQMKFELHLNN